jgi:hypothetical protein
LHSVAEPWHSQPTPPFQQYNAEWLGWRPRVAFALNTAARDLREAKALLDALIP